MLRRLFLLTFFTWSLGCQAVAQVNNTSQNKAESPVKSGQISEKDSPKNTKNTPKDIKKTKENLDAEIVLLAGLPLTKGNDAVIRYVRENYVMADLVKDPVLGQLVRLTLSKMKDNPEKVASLKEEHLTKVSEYFVSQALEAEAANQIPQALNLSQVAVRISPGNIKGKLLFANILHNNYSRTDEAIQTLRHGLEYVNASDPMGAQYLERYFQLLQLRERDDEVIEQSLKLLAVGKEFPLVTRQTLALAGATSLYWVGRYAESVNLINAHQLDQQASGLLLKARALFDGGKNSEAINLLDKRSGDFAENKIRDAIYSQQARFHILLGQPKIALAVTEERIKLDEKAPFPQLQKLQLLDRLGLKDDYDKQLSLIAERFSNSSAAMLALANFATERGYDGITAQLVKVAADRGFDRATFAALHLEALLNSNNPDKVIAQFEQVNAVDRTYFSSNLPTVQALVGIAYHARNKKDEKAAEADKKIGDRYLMEFLKSDKLGPEAYRSVGKKLKSIHAAEAAVRILESGIKSYPRYSQLRADYISARILAGEIEAYGTRKSVPDELESLLKMRRPSPIIWQESLAWIKSEAKLSREQRDSLEKSLTPLTRPFLDQEALAGR